jgi:hypothetical protein
MRIRTTISGSLVSTPYLYNQRTRSTCGASWFDQTFTYKGGSQDVKTVEDIQTPGFQACQKLGRFLPLNPFTISTVSEQILPYTSSLVGTWRVGTCIGENHSEGSGLRTISGFTLPNFEPNDVILGAVVNGAVAESRAAAWDGLTFLAELRETKALFASSIFRLSKLRDLLVKKHDADIPKKWRDAIKSKDYASLPREYYESFLKLWLEYRYGWSPIVYDIQSAVKALNTARKNTIAVGRSKQVDSGSSSKTSYLGAYNQYTSVETLEWNVTYRGWAASEFADDGRVSFDPLVTAYEVTTLSFVLDWLINVGTWLEAISPFQPGQTLGSCGSYQVDITRTRYLSGTNYTDATSNWTLNLPAQTVHTRNERLYSRLARGTTLPGWNPRITLPRQIDAIALASSFANGFSRQTWRL